MSMNAPFSTIRTYPMDIIFILEDYHQIIDDACERRQI